MPNTPLRVALIGCGQIADAHLGEIARIPAARAVAVCDRYQDLARQAAERFGVGSYFTSYEEMLRAAKPDVVHVTTPPATHLQLVRALVGAGVHVYVEKPFSVDTREAVEMTTAALAAGRLVCAGHDQLFDPVWRECRRVVESGALGAVVHIDSVQGYNLSGPYGAALSADADHWVRRLPGGLFQNVMSHALYKIVDLLPDDDPGVSAFWFSPPEGPAFPSELRAFIRGQRTTGTLTFTSSARPVQRVVRVFGTLGTIEVDFEARAIRRVHAARVPGVFGKVDIAWSQLCEANRNWRHTVSRLLHRDLHYFSGMHALFTGFYDAVLRGGPPPVSYRDVTRVARVSDSIFEGCAAELDSRARRGSAVVDERVGRPANGVES